MTDFIHFGTPPGFTGNPKSLSGDEFFNGETQIFVRTTGTVSGVPPVTVDSAAVTLQESAGATPLGSRRTFLMEDAYNGGYAQAISEHSDDAGSMTWVLGRGNYFPQTASNGEVIALDNEIDSQAKADAWAEVWIEWALDQLAAKEAAGLTVAGNPICLDPEDIGVDSAVGAADWNFAKTSGSTINAGGYSDARVGYTGDYNTDVSVALPFVLDALRQVTEAVKNAYPTSPVGWYNAGFLVYLPGWGSSFDTDTTNGTWAHLENVLTGLVTDDTNYYQHQFLGLCDFGFVPWYQGVGNAVATNLDNGNDVNIPGNSWHGYFNISNGQARALYLVLKYLGPSSTEGDGATKGDKLIFGLIEEYMATDGDSKNLDGGKVMAVRSALNGNTGGSFASIGSGTAASSTSPDNWIAGDLTYPDLSLLRGSSTLLGTSIPNPGDSATYNANLPGVYNVPYTKEEFMDYMSWMFTANSNNLPVEYSGCPTDAVRNVPGLSIEGDRLPDSMANMRMSIFDGTMATEYSYEPSGGGTNTVRSINGRWSNDDMSSLGEISYMQVLYSGYGNYKDYGSSVPGQTASLIFPSADKSAWFDADKKERAVAMITRSTSNFFSSSTSIGTVTVSEVDGTGGAETGEEESFEATISGDAGNLTYAFSVTAAGSGTATIDHASSSQNSCGITFNDDDTYTVTCTVTSGDANVDDSPTSGTLEITSTSSGPSVLARLKGTKAGSGTGFTITETLNPKRIGCFRWYNQYGGDSGSDVVFNVGNTLVNMFTSTQLRFGPAEEWSYNGTTIQPVQTSSGAITPNAWEDNMRAAGLIFRVTIDDGVTTSITEYSGSDLDTSANSPIASSGNFGGYAFCADSSVNGWNNSIPLTVTYEIVESSP